MKYQVCKRSRRAHKFHYLVGSAGLHKESCRMLWYFKKNLVSIYVSMSMLRGFFHPLCEDIQKWGIFSFQNEFFRPKTLSENDFHVKISVLINIFCCFHFFYFLFIFTKDGIVKLNLLSLGAWSSNFMKFSIWFRSYDYCQKVFTFVEIVNFLV